MLSTNQSFLRLNKLKKTKVEPLTKKNVSLDDLAFLVKRLSVQVDDLAEENQQLKQLSSPIQPIPQQQVNRSYHAVPMDNHSLHPTYQLPGTVHRDSLSIYTQNNHAPSVVPATAPVTHTTIDPWASYVPQNYGALLQRLEDIESLQKCPNDCCASTGTVSSADGVPWPQPIEPFQTSKGDTLDAQYTHWCTLMRCLPLMDPITSAHVKTVGLYAMREILKCKASQKKEPISGMATTTTKLRDSMRIPPPPPKTMTNTAIVTAKQDMPSWLTSSETKIGIADEVTAPIPPHKETTSTSLPSGMSSPTAEKYSRFQKWVQYKKQHKKSSTNPATPLHNQHLRKIGSWFF